MRKFHWFVFLLLTSPIVYCQSEGDAWDPQDDTALGGTLVDTPAETAVQHGPHTMSASDRVDWYFLYLEEGADYEFTTTGEAIVVGELYDNDAAAKLVGFDAPGTGEGLDLAFTPSRSGKYFIKVIFLAGELMTYTFHARLRQGPPLPVTDAWDPGDDTASGATDLGSPTVEEQSHGPHTLAFNDPSDWFKVNLSAGVLYEFRSSGPSDTVVHFFLPDGTHFAEQDSGASGGNFRLVYTPSVSGTYTLQVSAFTPGAAGSYTLHVQHVAPPSLDGDMWDPQDNERIGAVDLAEPSDTEQSHGYHSLSPIDTTDWFRVALPAGFYYEFVSVGEFDPSAELYTEDGVAPIAQDDDSGPDRNFSLRYSPTANGTFYLRVRAHSEGNALYKLLVRREAIPAPTAPILLRAFSLDTAEFTEQPGGFTAYPAGRVAVGSVPASTRGLSDGKGVTVTTAPGQVHMLIFPAVETTGHEWVLLRAAVHASGQGASVALAALDGSLDGSIAADMLNNSGVLTDDYRFRTVLYKPMSYRFHPILQVANLPGTEEVTVSFDNVEVYAIPARGTLNTNLLLPAPETDEPEGTDEPAAAAVYALDTLAGVIHLPGGFMQSKSGTVSIGTLPPDPRFARDTENPQEPEATGLRVTLPPDAVDLFLFPEIETGGNTVLIRAKIMAEQAGAAVAVAALDGSGEGTIGTNIPADSEILKNQYHSQEVLFQPPGGKVRPVFQVYNLGNMRDVTVFLDSVEIFRIPANRRIPNEFLRGE